MKSNMRRDFGSAAFDLIGGKGKGMKVSARWSDMGSNTVSMVDDARMLSIGCGVSKEKEHITVTISRPSQDKARKERFERQSQTIELSIEETDELIKRLNERVSSLKYFVANGDWPKGN